MSGPVSTIDAPPVADHGHATPPCMEISDDHEATVGRFRVRRALPRRTRRTVGAWCFADHMGPGDVTENAGLDIGPHPHIGLHTVTWLLEGQVLHRDSLGSEQVIKPGQLNLMAAGNGVTHSEEATGAYRGVLHGIQLWVAQPEQTRHGPGAFEHHYDLPRQEIDRGVAAVLVGDLAGVTSPVRQDTPLSGIDLTLRPGLTALPLRREFEYALIMLEGAAIVGEQHLAPGRLGYLGQGREELPLRTTEQARAILIGGEPFAESIVMWWNFVGRSRAELDAAYRNWRDGSQRFGRVDSALPRIPAPTPYWLSRLD